MPDELEGGEQPQPASALPKELHRGNKTKLTLGIAQGQSVREWARASGVPERTDDARARDPKVRCTVETCRRRTLDRAIGHMNRRAIWASDRIAELAKSAESESVQLRALRSIFSDVEDHVMIAPSSNDQTSDNLQQYEGPVKELRRIAPQLRLHGISATFDKNHGKRVITITNTNRPKNLPSRLSNNLIAYCDADSFEEEKSPET